jgi:purine-binding chemotaxis protein CheW
MPATLTKVPHTDSAMIGVTALRDRLLPLVSLRVLLGMPRDGSAAGSTRIVVARLGSMTVGLVVDAVTSALRVNSGSIDPVPPVLTRGKGEAQLEGICRVDGGRRLVCLLSTARLLDSQTMALIQMQIQQESAVMASAETQNDATEQFLIFRLGEEEYGLPIQAVDEVARRPDALVRLPRAPAFVEGVMNLRGRVIPVISQRKRFAVTDDGARSRRVVVVTVDGLQAGFAVDDVSEVVRVPAADLLAAPDIEAPGGMVFDRVLTRPDGRMILLISPRALLDQAERDLLASIATDEPAAVA